MRVDDKNFTGSVNFPNILRGLANRLKRLREDIYKNAERQIVPGSSVKFPEFTLTVTALEKGAEAQNDFSTLSEETVNKITSRQTPYNDAILNPTDPCLRQIIDNISTKVCLELKDPSGKTCSFYIPVVTIGTGFKESPRYRRSSNYSFNAVLPQNATQEEKELFLTYCSTTSGFKTQREKLNIPPLHETLEKSATEKIEAPLQTGIGKVLTASSDLDDLFESNSELISQITGLLPSWNHKFIPKNQEELTAVCEEISKALYNHVNTAFPYEGKILIKAKGNEQAVIAEFTLSDVCTLAETEMTKSLAKTPGAVKAIYEDILTWLNSKGEEILSASNIKDMVKTLIVKNAGHAVCPVVALSNSDQPIYLTAVPLSSLVLQDTVPINGAKGTCFLSSSIGNLESFL